MAKRTQRLLRKGKLLSSASSIVKILPFLFPIYVLILIITILIIKLGTLVLFLFRIAINNLFGTNPALKITRSSDQAFTSQSIAIKSKGNVGLHSYLFLSPPRLLLIFVNNLSAWISNLLSIPKKIIIIQVKEFLNLFNWKMITVIVLLLLGFYTFEVIKLTLSLPSPNNLNSDNSPLTTKIYDRNGNLLFQFYNEKNRDLIKLSDVPQNLINATIAIEDKNFYTHHGIDLLGIIRAAKSDFIDHNPNLQGASTITQQVIKNTLLSPDQTYQRKIKEILLALWTEMIYSKKDILTMYFNEVPYGGPAWGVEAASEMYFGKKVNQLDLAQSAYLAGLPAAPSEYSPYGLHPEKAKQRQKEVLQNMVDNNFITKAQAQTAYAEELNINPPLNPILAPHFVMYVKSILAQRYGEKTVSEGGLRVITTLDLNIQKMTEKVVADEVDKLSSLNVSQGAAMVTDAKTGEILAMVGSKNYFDPNGGNVNATVAIRPPGSSIKVVTYATAFKQGFTPGSVLLDTPTTFSNPWGQSYTPVNYDGSFNGPITIRNALGSSINIPAVKTLAAVGIPSFLATASDMGITTFTQPKKYGLSLTLGGAGVKMTDMMTVYGTLASGGIRNRVQPILTVTDSQGHVLEDHIHDHGERVLSPQVTYMLSNVLSDNNARVLGFGPNSQLIIPNHPSVAVKTGTSDDKRDNWAFGYTPKYVVGAWAGNFDNSPMNQAITSGVTGATPIWHDIMTNLLNGIPDEEFTRPEGIVEKMSPDGHKDLAIDGSEPQTMISYKKIVERDPITGTQREVYTYADPFASYTP